MDLGLALVDERLTPVKGLGSKRIKGKVALTRPEDVTPEVEDLLRQAYEGAA